MYVYADADGTEHAFYEVEAGSGASYTAVDEDGLQMRLTVLSTGAVEITDDSGLTRTFT